MRNRSLVWLAGLTAALAACQPTPSPVPIEQAKKVETSIGSDTRPPTVIPPPRTVEDILSLLKDIKPDPSYGADLHSRANAQPAVGLRPDQLASFLFDRGVARSDLGDIKRAVQDLRQSVELLKQNGLVVPDLYDSRLEVEEGNFGEPQTEVTLSRERTRAKPDNFGAWADLSLSLQGLGDIDGAEDAAAHVVRLAHAPYITNVVAIRARESMAARVRGQLGLARGQYVDAEASLRQAVTENDYVLANYEQLPAGLFQSRGFIERVGNNGQEFLVKDLTLQRRYAEAEAAGRETLVRVLQRDGATSANAARALHTLAGIISAAGRHRQAAKLVNAALDIYIALGLERSDGTVLGLRSALGVYQTRAGDFDDALATFAALQTDLQVLADQEKYDRLLGANPEFAQVEIRAGHPDTAIKIDAQCVQRLAARLGPDEFNTALCRAALGGALVAAGRLQDALVAFRAALPILIASPDDDPLSDNAAEIRTHIDEYLRLLDRIRGTSLESSVRDAASEAFRVADVSRSRAVQATLAEATTRMTLPDPALADLARRDQDLGNQRRELTRLLLAVASAPPDQHDQGAEASLRLQIAQLDATQKQLRAQIDHDFPRYADLLTPHGPTVEDSRAMLGPDEALIAISSLDDRTLVWAVAKDTPLAYVSVPLKRADLAADVAQLRRALDLTATSLGDIPPFDVVIAHKLYVMLLDPVARVWRGRKNLIIVPDGPLTQLPFPLLVARDVPQPKDAEGKALFSGYHEVPFLVRDVAVSQLPSVSALASLRRLPPGQSARTPFIGFGDPLFNADEVAEARREEQTPLIRVASRGGTFTQRAAPDTETLDTATISDLPRLPDTAEELRDAATALKADPEKNVYLGMQASEETVETLALNDRQVVMFATHGLLPGDLDGLTEPALALSPPTIAGGRGDGLLTPEKILGLKLDADWVVLSACNTGAGGKGAEAVSGLGRAFFYAGARSLLVTNWAVETMSARQLTTGIFRRQSEDRTLTRAEALRLSELDLIDGRGAIDTLGRVIFSYAHPIFWAPFSLIGDGS